MDSAKKDHIKKCVYHKEHGHTMEQCRSVHYLVERLIRVGHLRQYVRLEGKNWGASQGPATTTPATSEAPRVMINYIHGGPIDKEYNSKRKRQRLFQVAFVPKHISSIRPGLVGRSAHPIDGVIIFHPVDSNRILQPHRDALILTLGISDFDVRRILVDLGNSTDLLQVSVIKQMGFSPSTLENPRRILSGFNGASTTSLGDIVLLVQASPVTLNVQFSVVEDRFPFNAILGRTWLHSMKVILSTYHQMVSYLTEDG